jgi:hypothetical protein
MEEEHNKPCFPCPGGRVHSHQFGVLCGQIKPSVNLVYREFYYYNTKIV